MSEIFNVIECRYCGFLQQNRDKKCNECCECLFIDITLTEEEEKQSFYEVCKSINDAFFRFESFINNKIDSYYSFDFERHFLILFKKAKEYQNSNNTNYNLIITYYHYLDMMYWHLDKGRYDNTNANENLDFVKDSNQLCMLHNMPHEFFQFDNNDNDFEFNYKPKIQDINSEFFRVNNSVFDNGNYDSSNHSDYIKKIIFESHKDGWKRYFFEKEDYYQFVKLIVDYLKDGHVSILENKILIKKNTKSSLAKCFNEFYKKYARKNNLKSDTDYFHTIRCIKDYQEYTDEALYKLITK